MEILLQVKLLTSISFRSLSKQVVILKLYVQVIQETPSRTTIQNWVEKIGYYQLTRQKERAKDWVIILDHSIQLGQEKILVILGIRQSNIDFTRSLQYQDLETLLIMPSNKWTGEKIKEQLTIIENQIGKILYAVSDNGSDIKKGLELKGVPKVYDITHKIANIIRKLFEKDEQYQYLTKKMAEMRMKLGQTELAYMLPPNQRKKSRFLNIDNISGWAIKALDIYNNQSHELNSKIKESFSWIKTVKPIIMELFEINQAICKIEKIVKCYGLSKSTIKKSNKILHQLESQNGKIFAKKLKDYFNETMKELQKPKQILCCSDILESAFGKYKSYLSNNPMACLTRLCLSIAAFTSNLTKEEIQEGLEKIKLTDIKKWSDKNIGDTLFKRRMTEFVRAA